MTRARIVVVEDEEDIRELLEYVLTKEGFAVTSVADGRKGLEEIASSCRIWCCSI